MYVNLSRLIQLPRQALSRSFFGSSAPKPSKSNLSDKVKFEFNEENKCRAKELLSSYPEKELRGALLPLLDMAQRQHGWLPITAIEAVACMVKLEPFAVWEVANFYTMFHLRPVGKYVIKVCMTTPCQLRGCGRIFSKCQEILELKDGETSEDMEFTLKSCYCMGACVNGPVISVNDDLFEDLDDENLEKILFKLKEGNMPRSGPCNGRFASEPKSGPTSLLIDPPPAGHGMQSLCKPKPKTC